MLRSRSFRVLILPLALALISPSFSVAAEPVERGVREATLASLDWIGRHVLPDGRCSAEGFAGTCAKDAPCRALQRSQVSTSTGDPGSGEIAQTALAILAYLGYGHTHKDGELREYRATVLRMTEWLLSQQVKSDDPEEKGLFLLDGKRTPGAVVEHAIATMALSELLLLSRDKKLLQEPVEAATRWSLEAQTAGAGWMSASENEIGDTLTTIWMVLAMKTAKACSWARLSSIPKERFAPAFDGALAWLDSVTDPKTGRVGASSSEDPEKGQPTLTAGAALCEIFCGRSRTHPAVAKKMVLLKASLPSWTPKSGKDPSKIDPAYWYFGTYAMFQIGGSSWRAWRTALLDNIGRHQRAGTCANGSWDPLGESVLAHDRAAATALGVMTLEVYSRFKRSTDNGGPDPDEATWVFVEQPGD